MQAQLGHASLPPKSCIFRSMQLENLPTLAGTSLVVVALPPSRDVWSFGLLPDSLPGSVGLGFHCRRLGRDTIFAALDDHHPEEHPHPEEHQSSVVHSGFELHEPCAASAFFCPRCGR